MLALYFVVLHSQPSCFPCLTTTIRSLHSSKIICVFISDGTHICVSPPRKFRGPFRNRKGTLSINCILLAGASGLVYYCKSSSPGSRHDSSVFKSSNLFHKLDVEKWSPVKNGVIAADSGYATYYPFLTTPFCETTQNPREVEYNRKFCKARVHIENIIGRIKNRFRILLGDGIRIRDMNRASKVIQCCVSINNFIIQKDSEGQNIDNQHGAEADEHEPPDIPDWDTLPDSYRNGRARRTPTKEKILEKYF